MEVSLHLGAHRTGTTSLQRYLGLNRKTLSDNAVAYWGPRQIRSGLLPGLMCNPDRLTAADRKLARRSVGRAKMEQTRLGQKGFSHLIVSEENMIGTMGQNLRSAQLYPQTRARLDRLAPAFGGHALRIAIAIRSYDNHWASQMAHHIKVGGAYPSTEKLDRLATQPRRWRHVIEDIAAVFPEAEITVWPFEGWIGQPEQMLSSLLGWPIPMGLVKFNERCNASPDAQNLCDRLQDAGDLEGAAALGGHFGPFQPFPQLHREKLKDDYRADIDWLQAGADGLATYLDPTGGTSGGHDRPKGSTTHDLEERRLARAR